MRFGTGRPRLTAARRRLRAFSGRVQLLEPRTLLTGLNPIDLGGQVAPDNYPALAVDQSATITPAGTLPYGPFGIEEAGGVASQGAGFTVTDVGDMNSDGFDDYVIGAPMITSSGGLTLGSSPTSTPNSEAYLIFGSETVNQGNISWLLLHSLETTNGYENGQLRIGSLSNPGATTQTNPITNDTGYQFAGVTFQTASNPNSQLGASVAAIPGGINGVPSFLLGAPNGFALNDTTGSTPRYGRAYLINGTTLSEANPVINLDAASGSQGAQYITFGANTPAANASNLIGIAGSIGRSVAAIPNFFSDNGVALAFGAPTADYNGLNSGAVYVIAQSAYAGAATVNLATVGQSPGLRGVIFGGAATDEYAGVSVANAGNINKHGTINDLLIGAPGTMNPFTQAPSPTYAGNAYLIYGVNTLPAAATLTDGTNGISLGLIGDPVVTTGDVAGADFLGAGGDATGYSVSTAGDVNDDGYDDFLIGAPLANGSDGRATLIYGQTDLVNTAANGTTNPILGTIFITTFPLTEVDPATGNVPTATGASSATAQTPPPIFGADFNGGTGLYAGEAGDMAGFSVGYSGPIPLGAKYDDILIGAPGYTFNPTGSDTGPSLASQGEAFIVPGYGTLYGGNEPLDYRVGLQLQFGTIPNQSTPAYFGASVGGTAIKSTQVHTADADLQADPIIGAPGYGITNAMARSGGSFIVEGSNAQTTTTMDSIGGSMPVFLPNVANQVPISTATPAPTTAPKGPYTVSATATTMTFFVYSQAAVNGITGNNFDPVRGIDTSANTGTNGTLLVNGIPFPATVTKDATDENNDGIEDAIVTVTLPPNNFLGLVNGPNQTITLSGLIGQGNPSGLLTTTTATPLTGEFAYSVKVTVINGRTVTPTPTPTPSSGGVAAAPPPGLVVPTTLTPQFGNDVYIPTPAALSTFDYQPIPEKTAYKEYKPTAAFVERTLNYLDPAKYHFQPKRVGGKGRTLPQHAFDTSKYHPAKKIEYTHKVPVVPTNLQHERLTPIRASDAKKK